MSEQLIAAEALERYTWDHDDVDVRPLPEGVLPVEEWGWTKTRVFVYGTLMHSAMRDRILQRGVPAKRATLNGWAITYRGGLATIVPSADSVVHGALIEVDDRGLQALDYFEGCDPENEDRSLYRRVQLVPGMITYTMTRISDNYDGGPNDWTASSRLLGAIEIENQIAEVIQP